MKSKGRRALAMSVVYQRLYGAEPGTLDATLTQLYRESRFLSGGFDRNPLFAAIVGLGTSAVPRLLRDLAEPSPDVHVWVVFHLLHEIVGPDAPTTAPDDAGKLEPVTTAWLMWGHTKGLLP